MAFCAVYVGGLLSTCYLLQLYKYNLKFKKIYIYIQPAENLGILWSQFFYLIIKL